LTNKLLLF